MPMSATNGRWVDDTTVEPQRTYALLTHLAGLLSLLDMSIAGPIATLVMWRIKAKESAFLDDHGREAMNFQISLVIYSIVAIPLTIVSLGLLAFPLLAGIWVLRLVGGIRGAMAASRGEYYRYPMCIRLIPDPV
jgi:uncharacterized Tic20 family protein